MAQKKWTGSWVDLTTLKRWNGTTWVDLTIAKRWDGGSWVDMGAPSGSLSATANATNVFGSGGDDEGDAFQQITSSPATVITSTGGAGAGPTYSWTKLSGSSAILADSPTSATTTFSAYLGFGITKTAVMRCTVTRGVDSVTVDVNVSLTNTAERTGVPA